jgi:hypothetical protein
VFDCGGVALGKNNLKGFVRVVGVRARQFLHAPIRRLK